MPVIRAILRRGGAGTSPPLIAAADPEPPASFSDAIAKSRWPCRRGEKSGERNETEIEIGLFNGRGRCWNIKSAGNERVSACSTVGLPLISEAVNSKASNQGFKVRSVISIGQQHLQRGRYEQLCFINDQSTLEDFGDVGFDWRWHLGMTPSINTALSPS